MYRNILEHNIKFLNENENICKLKNYNFSHFPLVIEIINY